MPAGGVDADDGCRLCRLPRTDRPWPRGRPGRQRARVLRVPRRDTDGLGRRRRRVPRPRRRSRPGRVEGRVRYGWRTRPRERRAARALHAPGHGAGCQPAQVDSRARRDRPRRGHAHDPRRGTRRHNGLPRRGCAGPGRQARACTAAHAYRRPHLGGVPSCDDKGR